MGGRVYTQQVPTTFVQCYSKIPSCSPGSRSTRLFSQLSRSFAASFYMRSKNHRKAKAQPSPAQLSRMIIQLALCNFPSHCPHPKTYLPASGSPLHREPPKRNRLRVNTHIVLLIYIQPPPIFCEAHSLLLCHALHLAVVPFVAQGRRGRQEERASHDGG